MSQRLVEAAIFDTPAQAHIAQGMLEANGIMSVLNNEIFASIYPIGFNSIGGIPLLVNADDLERAQQLLRRHHDDSL